MHSRIVSQITSSCLMQGVEAYDFSLNIPPAFELRCSLNCQDCHLHSHHNVAQNCCKTIARSSKRL